MRMFLRTGLIKIYKVQLTETIRVGYIRKFYTRFNAD